MYWVGRLPSSHPLKMDEAIMYKTILILIAFFSSLAAGAYQYDPNDFAAEVISYTQGTGVGWDILDGMYYNNPATALDRPSNMTTSASNPNIWMRVVPVCQPFRSFEIVTIGNGGQLTLKFNHPVVNDEKNLYGIDFIIFGNAWQAKIGEDYWELDSNPEDVEVLGTVSAEPAIVSVSQDGQIWYRFSTGPYADDFSPTCGFDWDSVNHSWGGELDPTRPINPNLTAEGMGGKTVAEIIDLYDGSAGGTGFDIGILGLDWIQYVRIEDKPGVSKTAEIDAISDVSACGDYRHPYPIGDLNQDCRVNIYDFCFAMEQGDGIMETIEVTDHWLECTWDCE